VNAVRRIRATRAAKPGQSRRPIGPRTPADGAEGPGAPESAASGKFSEPILREHRRLVIDQITCRRCPRLVAWREAVARAPRAAFREWVYWGRPVPGFGDPGAWLWIVGLAPAAHGGNRTGRVFTGDRSGEWLFRALHRARLANQPISESRDDGLRLTGAYIGAAVRCAPPDNKPWPIEFTNCREYLRRERALLSELSVIVALGKLAFDEVLKLHAEEGFEVPRPRPVFGHLARVRLAGWGTTLLGSYHPSQQNTFTGKLTEDMLEAVFRAAWKLRRERRPASEARVRKLAAAREQAGTDRRAPGV
jgi:uracil-DNA glycosylase family 4